MNRDVPRDPISDTRAVRDDSRKSVSDMSSREIEEEIHHTRAHMSSTLNAIEERVSPARLKSELQETLFATVDRVGEKFHPQKIAKRAGDNMMDTIRDNPVPALLAGLSIGYMVFKGSDSDGDGRNYRDGRYRSRAYIPAYERDMYREDVYPSRHPSYPAQYESEYGEGRARGRTRDMENRARDLRGQAEGKAAEARDRAGNAMHDVKRRAGDAADEAQHRAGDAVHSAQRKAGEAVDTAQRKAGEAVDTAQHRAGEAARDVQHFAGDAMHEAGHQARRVGRKVTRRARRAENTVEDFVYDNPLMAGLIAAGAGALLGSMLPSTDFEDRQIGPIRDDLMDDASDLADEAQQRASNVAEDAKEELKESGQRIAETAKSEAKDMRKSAEERKPTSPSDGGRKSGEPQRGSQNPAL